MAVENVVELKLNFNDNGLVELQQKQLDLIQRQVKYQKQMKDAVNETLQEAVASEKKYTDAIKENLSQLKNQDLQLKKTSLSAQLYEAAVDRATDSLGAFKGLGTSAINSLKGFASGMAGSIKGATGFVRVLKLVRAAVISTGIGALVVVIAGLVTALLRVESVGKQARATLAGLSASFDALTGRLATVGQAVIGFVTGTKSLSQAAKEAGSAFKGVGKEIGQAFTNGKNLQLGYEALTKRTRELAVSQAESEKTLARLNATANNEALSTSKRIAATAAAGALEKKLLNERLSLERENLKLKEQEIRNRGRLGSTEALEKERADILINIKNIQADLISQTAEYGAAVRGLKDAEQERLNQLNEAYQKILSDLDQRLTKASSAGLTGIEKLLAERDAAIAELVDFQAQIEAAAAAAGKEVPESVKAQIGTLIKGINDEFTLQADKIRNEDGFDVIGKIIPLADKEKVRDIEAIIGENTERAARAAVDAAVKARPLFQKVKDELMRALNVSEQELDTVVGFLEQGISQIDDIFLASTQVQIAQAEALISVTQKRVDTAKKAYDDELKLQQDGLANYAKVREDELNAEQRRLEDAQRKREALEKKSLRQQLLADSLAQGSQLALAASKVLSAEAPKGLPGILLAAAGIALIFKIIAAARANAVKSAQASIPKFRGGGQLLQGPSHEQGGIPIVFGNSQVVEAEGGEFIIRKKSSTVNEEFFHRVNKGEYDHLNLTKTIEQANQGRELARRFNAMGETGSRMAAQHRIREAAAQDQTIKRAIDGMKEEIVEVVVKVLEEIQERPVITPTDSGYRKEYRRGRIKYKETFRPKKD